MKDPFKTQPRPDGQTVLSLTPMDFEAYLPVLAGDLLSPRRFAFLERLARPQSFCLYPAHPRLAHPPY